MLKGKLMSLRDRLDQALYHASTSNRARSDFDLDPEKSTIPSENLRPAAVLVPIIDYASGAKILLTRRAEHLSKHAGQISFPGGKLDETDSTPEAAAVRETAEEIGVSKEYIDIIGRLDPYITVTSFQITPVVAVLKPGVYGSTRRPRGSRDI